MEAIEIINRLDSLQRRTFDDLRNIESEVSKLRERITYEIGVLKYEIAKENKGEEK